MAFETALKVMLLNDRHSHPWITIAPLVYESALTGETYWVPENFRTDGASIPRALILMASPLAMRFMGAGVWQGFKQGVLHDWLRRPDKATGKPPVSAKVAHLIFKEALTDAGYSDDLVSAYYTAVTLFNSD